MFQKTASSSCANMTVAYKIFQKTSRYPFCILDITLLPWKLFDEVRVDKFQGEIRLKDTPDRHPVDACTFHAHLGCIVFMQHVNLSFQVGSKHSDLVLKENSVFVENAHKNTIFVHIKTTYCSHRLLIFEA